MKPPEFFKKYGPLAVNDSVFSNIPASITLAQAAIESGWGEDGIAKKANNFFGIKAHNWTGAVYNAKTNEYYGGSSSPVIVDDSFRWYGSVYESFADHARFLHKYSRYDNLFELNPLDYKGWAIGLQNAKYATSPTYAADIIRVIEKYNLQEYDLKAANQRVIKNVVAVILILLLALAAYLMIKSLFK